MRECLFTEPSPVPRLTLTNGSSCRVHVCGLGSQTTFRKASGWNVNHAEPNQGNLIKTATGVEATSSWMRLNSTPLALF
jgi:hypothetical protein